MSSLSRYVLLLSKYTLGESANRVLQRISARKSASYQYTGEFLRHGGTELTKSFDEQDSGVAKGGFAHVEEI